MRLLFAVLIFLVALIAVSRPSRTEKLTEELDENGALGLIIRAYVDNIFRNTQEVKNDELSKQMLDSLKVPFSKIHKHVIGHPALKEKRLWVGRNKPTFDPTQSEFKYGSGSKSTKQRRQLPIPDEVCRTDRHWELINQTVDMNGKKVEIIQREDYLQYVFVYKCHLPRSSCTGISNYYKSECEMRQGWVMMYHRVVDNPDGESKWDYVAIPHHCACKITAKRPFKL